MNVAHFYVEAESAVHEKIERREQILSLMRDVREGDLVVVDKLDRWSRDPEFTYSSVRKIREASASFYSVSEQCDPSTPEGDTMLGFRILFAKEEHKRIKERMVGTRRLLRDRGYYADGLAPFGYRRPLAKGERGATKNILEVDPAAAQIVRRAFRLCIAGQPISKIAERLAMKRDRVAGMLSNRVYLGEIRDSGGQWIRSLHDRIIDADTFEQAAAARASRTLGGARAVGQDAETATWILRDVARCFRCGARMGAAYAGPKGAKRRHYYRCLANCTSAYVRVDAVEGAAAGLIVSRLHDLREELASSGEPATKPRVVDTSERRRALNAKRARYVEVYTDGHMTRDEYDAAMAKLDAARLKLDAEDARARRVSPLEDEEVRHEVLREVGVIAKRWAKADAATRREIVGHLCTAMRLAANCAPRPVWRSNEALAAEVLPVNASTVNTCFYRGIVDCGNPREKAPSARRRGSR